MTGIFYGSTLGTTETLANQIATELGIDSSDVLNVSDASTDNAISYKYLLLGSSTWGLGELQDDWYDFLSNLKKCDLTGIKVGLFGTGDGDSYPDTFCDALGLIYDELADTGCEFIGSIEPTDYTYTDSLVSRNGRFLGLAVDENNESELTEVRLSTWITSLKEAGV